MNVPPWPGRMLLNLLCAAIGESDEKNIGMRESEEHLYHSIHCLMIHCCPVVRSQYVFAFHGRIHNLDCFLMMGRSQWKEPRIHMLQTQQRNNNTIMTFIGYKSIQALLRIVGGYLTFWPVHSC